MNCVIEDLITYELQFIFQCTSKTDILFLKLLPVVTNAVKAFSHTSHSIDCFWLPL